MASVTSVPVEVTQEAAARTRELGLERELQELIEHTRRTIPDLRSIEVSLCYDDEGPQIQIGVWLNSSKAREKPVWDELICWRVDTYPPHVSRWVTFDVMHWDSYGR
jgi:hypothetical protein